MTRGRHGEDERWQAAQDAAAIGDRVVPMREAAPDEGDGRWLAELAFYRELEADGQPGPADADPVADAAIIEAALAATADDGALSDVEVDKSPGERSRAVAPVVALVVAVAAAALVWVAWPTAATLSTSRGSWIARDGGKHTAGGALPLAMWLLADQESCADIDGDTFCVASGTTVRVRDFSKRELELERGEIRVESGRWSVVVAGEQQTLRAGDSVRHDVGAAPVNAADAPPATKPETAVPSTPDDITRVTEAVAVPVARPRTQRPRASAEDAATRLKAARKLRGSKQTRAADRAYAEVIQHFPKTTEASAARVALGRIRLETGRTKSALGLFNAYLKGGGPLAEEAAWGKIQALDRLGRTDALRSAVSAFEAKFPRSVYRKRAQERVAQ